MTRCGLWAFLAVLLGVPVVGNPSPLLEWLGGNARVVIGEAASAVEREAAMKVCRALTPGDPMARVLTDTWVAAHPAEAGTYDLIVVGTPQSNGALREYPSLWWRTPEQEGSATFPVKGLYLFGAGDLPGRSVGVVEPCRNPYAIASREEAPNRGEPVTWIIRCGGRFPEGSAAAVRALLDDVMLSGAVLDARAASEVGNGLEIDPGVLTAAPPGWSRRSPAEGLTQLGWHQADRLLMDTLVDQLGARPLGVWRLAFRSKEGPHDIAANLHRRNTANEVLLCRMKDSEAASSAVRCLLGSLGSVREGQEGALTVLEVASGGGMVYGAATGAFWGVESMDAPLDRTVLAGLLSNAPR